MKKLMLVLVALALLIVPSAAIADGPDGKPECTTIPSGELVDSMGNPLTTGYNQYGYNYQARISNQGIEEYCQQRNDIPEGQPGHWDYDDCMAYFERVPFELVMKWSDVWLSNKDCNGDGLLDRGYACDPEYADNSACEGAWLTNHQRGEYEGDEGQTCKWTDFVKIVYPPGGPVDSEPDGYDDNTGGEIIWGEFVIIQQVFNDTCAGEHGNIFSVQPTGFGPYK